MGTGCQSATSNLQMTAPTTKLPARSTSTHPVSNLVQIGITRIKRKEKTIKTMIGIRLIIVGKEIASYKDMADLINRMSSKEDFDTFVVWDVDHPIDRAFISLRSYLEKQNINCNGEEKDS